MTVDALAPCLATTLTTMVLIISNWVIGFHWNGFQLPTQSQRWWMGEMVIYLVYFIIILPKINSAVEESKFHYSDVLMGAMAYQITSLTAQIKENIKAPRHRPCKGNSPVTGEFPAQRASDAENVSIWWRHHLIKLPRLQSCTYFERYSDIANFSVKCNYSFMSQAQRLFC